MNKPIILADRVRAALVNVIPSADAAAVLAEAREAHSMVESEVGEARRVALDPLSSVADAEAARAKMERLGFDRERIAAQIEALVARVAELQAGERAAAGAAEYEAARGERDELAADLKARAPGLIAELAGLLGRIEASDARLAMANRNLEGREWLSSAEAVARGVNESFRVGELPLRRLGASRLVGFEADHNNPMAWPETENVRSMRRG